MKTNYRIDDDIFVVIAFGAFLLGVVLKLLGIPVLFWGISPMQLIKASGVCLLFSIALSLRYLAHAGK